MNSNDYFKDSIVAEFFFVPENQEVSILVIHESVENCYYICWNKDKLFARRYLYFGDISIILSSIERYFGDKSHCYKSWLSVFNKIKDSIK